MTDTCNMDISVVDFHSVWRFPSCKDDAPPITCAEVALAACCSNCGGQPVVDNGECDPCRKYRDRNRCTRPAKLIKRAAKRHEIKERTNTITSSILVAEDLDCALTLAEYKAQRVITVECSEPHCDGTPYDKQGRCKLCADLSWYRSTRPAA